MELASRSASSWTFDQESIHFMHECWKHHKSKERNQLIKGSKQATVYGIFMYLPPKCNIRKLKPTQPTKLPQRRAYQRSQP
jgi:hypothetical protein